MSKVKIYFVSSLIFIFTALVGFIAPGALKVNAAEYTEIGSYISLPYINNGEVNIEYIGINAEKKEPRFDIYFNSGSVVYIRKNVGLPVIYDRTKNYITTYKVIDVDNEKRAYINFKVNEDEQIEWELTTGDYRSNNVVTVKSHELKAIYSGLGRDYWSYFSTDIKMDTIYKADVKYTTYKYLYGFKWGYKTHEKPIIRKEIIDNSSVFRSFLSKFIPSERILNIQESDDPKYEHKINIGYLSDSLRIEKYQYIKFYYVTNGKYYESDEVISPPVDYDYGADLTDIKILLDKIFIPLKFITDNFDLLLKVIILIIFLALLAPVISIFSIIFKLIGLIIKSSIFIIKLPFTLISKGFNIKNKKPKYKFKGYRT